MKFNKSQKSLPIYSSALEFLEFLGLREEYTKEELYDKLDKIHSFSNGPYEHNFDKYIRFLERNIGINNTDNISYYLALKFLEFSGLKDGYTKEELYDAIDKAKVYMEPYKERFNECIIVLERNIGIYNTNNLSYYSALGFLEFLGLREEYTKEELYDKLDKIHSFSNGPYEHNFDKYIRFLERNIGINNTDNISYYLALKFLEFSGLKDGYTKEELYDAIDKAKVYMEPYKERFNECIRVLEGHLEFKKINNETGGKLNK